MSSVLSTCLAAADRGWLPDTIIRSGIRHLCEERLKTLNPLQSLPNQHYLKEFITAMDGAEIAPLPDKANSQHYELPPEFFELVLGDYKKYSCCYWNPGDKSLVDAERSALQITCDRAQIEDGQRILELGCGWGALSLWMATNFPNTRITALSNSAAQRHYIESQARSAGLNNLEVKTCDINIYTSVCKYDRIVSIEMFEHLRNYRMMFDRIASWLTPGGKLFIHIFAHAETPYTFCDEGPSDWMSRHFFTGGMMPSHALPLSFEKDLVAEKHWRWNGHHYHRTAESWLVNLDHNRSNALTILKRVYGKQHSTVWFQRWRIFFMACAELFAMKDGEAWGVSHYRFIRNDNAN